MAEERATLEGLREKWGPGISLEDSSLQISDVTEYVRFKTLEYRIDNLQDVDLWEALQDDFPGFTAKTFKNCLPTDICKLRIFLRTNGVWVQNDRHITVAQSLHNTILEEERTRWTREAVREHLAAGGEFNSYYIQYHFGIPSS
jgi:hypothetical protein